MQSIKLSPGTGLVQKQRMSSYSNNQSLCLNLVCINKCINIIKSNAKQIICPSAENELKFENAVKLIKLERKVIINPFLRKAVFSSFIKEAIPIVNKNELNINIWKNRIHFFNCPAVFEEFIQLAAQNSTFSHNIKIIGFFG